MSVHLQPKSFRDVCSSVTILDCEEYKICIYFDLVSHTTYKLCTVRDINKAKEFKSYDTAINYLVKLGFTDINIQPFIEFTVPGDDVDCVLITN